MDPFGTGTDKRCVCTGPGISVLDQFSYPVPIASLVNMIQFGTVLFEGSTVPA